MILGSSVSMWLWIAVTSMPFDAQRADHVLDFRADEREVAGDRRLAAAGRLEVDGGRTAHDRCADRHSLLGDAVTARHVDRVDSAVVGALCPDDLVDLRRVEVDGGGRCGGRRDRERRLADRKSVVDGLRHLRGIAVSADVHVERQRLGAQQVVMNGGDFEAAFDAASP